jgi:hypothetical protein
MIVSDFGGEHEVSGNAHLEAALAARYGNGVNEFWIRHPNQRFPAIVILANKNLACVHYLTEQFDPGYQSVGPAEGLDPKGTTAFFVNTPTEILPMLNRSVVKFSLAVEAVKEFSKLVQLPVCIKWFRL